MPSSYNPNFATASAVSSYLPLTGGTVSGTLAVNGALFGSLRGTVQAHSATESGTITLNNTTNFLVLTQLSSVAAYKVILPVAPDNGQEAVICSKSAIISLSMAASAGHSINGAITSLAASGDAGWVFYNNNWYKTR